MSVPPVWLMSKHSMRLGASSKVEGLAQILEARLDAGARQAAHGERLLGVVVHHLQPARANAAHRDGNAHLVAGALRQRGLEHRHFVEFLLDDDFRRRLALQVVLRDEGGQHFRQLGKRRLREKSGAAEAAAGANEHQGDAVFAVAGRDPDDVGIMIGVGGDDLLRLNGLELRELVAQLRGLLEVQQLARPPPCAGPDPGSPHRCALPAP